MRQLRFPVALVVCALSAVVGCGDDPLTSRPPIASAHAAGPLRYAGVVGTPVAPGPSVLIRDVDGVPVAGVHVSWRVISGGGSVSRESVPTDSSGIAAVAWTLGQGMGENVLAAVVPDVAERITFTARAVARGASDLVKLAGDQQVAVIRQPLARELSVFVGDRFSNPIPGHRVRWTVGGGGSLDEMETATDSSGVARARWRLGLAAGEQMVTVTADGLPAQTFTASAVLPGTLEQSSRSYERDGRMYLEVLDGADTVRVGIDEKWGASIVEVSLNGTNFVNAYDPGREIQLALYDGAHDYDACAACTGVWGWNPVQGGDRHGNGSTVLEKRLGPGLLYVKVRPNHWAPDALGQVPWWDPVPADVVVEQWISADPRHPGVIRVGYRLTHLGSDRHGATVQQEFPAMYVDLAYRRFVHYAGSAPWTDAPVTITSLPSLFPAPQPMIHTAEHWGAFLADGNVGITLYAPGGYPYMRGGLQSGTSGPRGSGAAYTHPYVPFGIEPREVIDGEIYLLLGDYRVSRQVVAELRRGTPVRDLAAPIVHLDGGVGAREATGTVAVTGWVTDNIAPLSVEVFVDDTPVGRADPTAPRPEVARVLPGSPPASGFSRSIDTRRYSDGRHLLRVRTADAAGNVSEASIPITIRNP